MKRQAYSLSGKWTIQAPLDATWAALHDPEAWKKWWPDIKTVKQLEQPKLVAVRWRGIPGHIMHIVVDTEEFKEQDNQQYKFSGDIVGKGELWLRPKGKQTTVITYGWEVQTVQPWMNFAPAWVQKLFIYAAERSLRRAERGLGRYLAEK